jgi:glucose-1-phosphate thymidylyltransferase
MKVKRGIILAGGIATRLKPITSIISKHLLPIYNKPMIYYPLSTLMLGGIREYLIITNPSYLKLYQELLGYGDNLGINIRYKVQKKPEGLPQAFIIGEKFINNEPVCLNLGDHIFFGNDVNRLLKKNINSFKKTTIFAYRYKKPNEYGVINLNKKNRPISILEKPIKPKSNLIVCGLYIYDKNVVELSKSLKFSKRGELEISDLNNLYLKNNTLNVEIINKKNHWIDAGSPEKIFEASKLIKSIEKRKKSYIGFPEIVALKKRYITINDFTKLIRNYKGNYYGRILNTFLSKNFIN